MWRKRKRTTPPGSSGWTKKARLQSGAHWIKTYEGKRLVRGYARHFGVDALCAALELCMLGVDIPEDQVKSIRASKEADVLKKKKRREEKARAEEEDRFFESNGPFAYIAGYTSGGAPFGVTWEEMEAIERGERKVLSRKEDGKKEFSESSDQDKGEEKWEDIPFKKKKRGEPDGSL